MKILHTSDWHLGHILFNYSRSEEQKAFLTQLADIVSAERPDLMVVSGDVFHYSNPSAAAQTMYTEAMLHIHEACPSMAIVITAGNHDSCSRLEVDRSLWQHFGVTVIGSIAFLPDGTPDFDRHIVCVKNAAGSPVGYVAAVPFVFSQNFPTVANISKSERQVHFYQSLLQRVSSLNTESLPVVLMAHLAVTGSDVTGHDETVGGMEYTDISELGSGYDYLALGHIHCPQDIKNTAQYARYCGSPLPVSFDEVYPHSVTVVDIQTHKAPNIRTIAIDNPKPLLTLPKDPVPFEEALKIFSDMPDDSQGYVRLNVQLTDGYLAPDSNERVIKFAEGKLAKYCYININRDKIKQQGVEKQFTINELQTISPIEIAQLYYSEHNGIEMSDDLRLMLDKVIIRVKSDRNEF